MATQDNLDQVRNDKPLKKPSDRDDPEDLIEANDPEEGSDPLDPEGSIVEPIDELNPDDPSSPEQIIDPLEPNDPGDPQSPVNRMRGPEAPDTPVNDFGEGENRDFVDLENQPGEDGQTSP